MKVFFARINTIFFILFYRSMLLHFIIFNLIYLQLFVSQHFILLYLHTIFGQYLLLQMRVQSQKIFDENLPKKFGKKKIHSISSFNSLPNICRFDDLETDAICSNRMANLPKIQTRVVSQTINFILGVRHVMPKPNMFLQNISNT